MECLRGCRVQVCRALCPGGGSAEDWPRPTPARGDTSLCTHAGVEEGRGAPTPTRHSKPRWHPGPRNHHSALRRAGSREHLGGRPELLGAGPGCSGVGHGCGSTACLGDLQHRSSCGSSGAGAAGGDHRSPARSSPCSPHRVWSQSPHKAQRRALEKNQTLFLLFLIQVS